MDSLDPVVLLKQIRECQENLVAISQKRSPETNVSELTPFVKNLAIAWKAGEVRPTHRREPKRKQWWRARPDPFAELFE